MRPQAFKANRRQLVTTGLGLGLVAACARGRSMVTDEEDEKEEVTPTEDLMREHGVLERLLLVYEEVLARLEARAPAPVPVLVRALDLTRRFIEDYHEKLEEQFVFPRFEAAGRHLELVATLRRQHDRGREYSDAIRRASEAAPQEALAPDGPLQRGLRGYIRMMRPHAAREDTVVFPAFRELVGVRAFVELGEQFEAREHALFGPGGFGTVVAEVAALETALDIHELTRFTP